MRLHFHAARRKLLKPAKEHAPDVSILWRQGPSVGQPLHSGPWKRDLGEPSLVHYGRIVDSAIHLDSGAHPWEVPIQKCPNALTFGGDYDPAAPPIGVLPDKEHFINGA